MTDLEKIRAWALKDCKLTAGSFEVGFVASMNRIADKTPKLWLTPKQRDCLVGLCWKHRDQLARLNYTAVWHNTVQARRRQTTGGIDMSNCKPRCAGKYNDQGICELCGAISKELNNERREKVWHLMKRFESLPDEDRKYVFQYFMGGISMTTSGFKEPHADQPHALWVMGELEKAIAQKG